MPWPLPAAEERFERELGEFVVEGACPRCGRVLERGQRAHLRACGGEAARARAPRAEGGPPRPRDAAVEELTEEERKSAKKRLLARMKHVGVVGGWEGWAGGGEGEWLVALHKACELSGLGEAGRCGVV